MKNDIYKIVVMILMSAITALLSLLINIGSAVLSQNRDILGRLRTVELNQARLMERMGVQPKASSAQIGREMSKKTANYSRPKNQSNQNLLTCNASCGTISDNQRSLGENINENFTYNFGFALCRMRFAAAAKN